MQPLFFHMNSCQPCKNMQKVAEQYAEQTGIPLFTFRCDDVYGGNEMAKHYPVLDFVGRRQGRREERYRTESVHTLETLQNAFSQQKGVL